MARTWLVAAAMAFAPCAAAAQSRVTVVAVGYHSTGEACGNFKSVAGWEWESTTSGSTAIRKQLLDRLAAKHGPLFQSSDVAVLTQPVTAIITYDKKILGWSSCAPRRMLMVGEGADSTSALADAVRRKDLDVRGAAYKVEQIIR